MSLFQQRFNDRVVPAADRAFGVSATLEHGGHQTAEFTVQWEDQQYDTEDAEGFTTKFHSRDFLFAASDAVVDGVAIEPRRGDVLRVTENGTPKQFEIVPVGTMPAAELLPGGYRWRVHTKQVK